MIRRPYQQHQLTKEQFRDDTVDAAEIGAAESGTALYVIQVNPNGQGPLGVVRVRYQVPFTNTYREMTWPLIYQPRVPALDQSGPAMRLAASAAAFAEWLAGNPYSSIKLSALPRYLNGIPEVYTPDPRPAQLEWMIRQALTLAGHQG